MDEAYPQRLLVKKLGREFLVKVEDIDYVEAAGNYMNLYVAERTYPLLSTMQALLQKLRADTYRRVHRSYIVNLNAIEEITGFDKGDAEIRLKGGQCVPMSRTYKQNLRDPS